MITAIVNGNDKLLSDGSERLYLHVNKKDAHGLPYRDGVKVNVTLVIGGIEYIGKLGARSDYR